jgi:hypothetical protein
VDECRGMEDLQRRGHAHDDGVLVVGGADRAAPGEAESGAQAFAAGDRTGRVCGEHGRALSPRGGLVRPVPQEGIQSLGNRRNRLGSGRHGPSLVIERMRMICVSPLPEGDPCHSPSKSNACWRRWSAIS